MILFLFCNVGIPTCRADDRREAPDHRNVRNLVGFVREFLQKFDFFLFGVMQQVQ